MFFETTDISILDLSTVENISYNFFRSGRANGRRFHSLSFRIDTDVVLETEHGKVWTKPGDIVFMPAFCGYSVAGNKDKFIVVHFYSNSCLPRRLKKFTPQDTEYYNRKFTELYDCWIKKFVGYKHECLSILYKIITRIERDFAEIKAFDVHERMFEIIDFIHENFSNSSLTVADLAKKCFMSETYFRQIFNKTFGVTPLKYINDLKLNFALELLKTTNISVSEASYKAGFSNPNYFSTVFKKELGVSPREYISRMNSELDL